VNAELSEKGRIAAWVLYDADCGLCTRMVRRFGGMLARRRLELLPLQTRWVRERLALNEPELLVEMRLLLPDGTFFGGADALVEISRRFWWARPLSIIGSLPPGRALLRAGYRWIARRRGCVNNTCAVPVRQYRTNLRFTDFLPLLIFPAIALFFKAHLAAWVFMWVLALSIYAGCKWLTYRDAVRPQIVTRRWRSLVYLFGWPGMDARRFLRDKKAPLKPSPSEWLFGAGKTLLGVVLLWTVAHNVMPDRELLAGWMGMIAVVFLLHFGLFHLLSLLWRNLGIDAMPVMRDPLLSGSLAEFWGKRWNTAFHELASRFAFRPLRHITTPAVATLLVFFLSGLVHELVISLPAGAGYGLPTAYFLIQGTGLNWERTTLGRRLGLGHGVRGWIFTVFIVAAPAMLLFHPPFIHNVILPMLRALGAT
jgi:predicted DCC family thiol-disulfide oxidoreductase YuxK